jgi:hypothetical protein
MKRFSRSLKQKAIFVVVLLCFAALTGCDYLPFGYVPVKDIVSNPAQYEGQKIKVKGVVSDVTKISLLGIRWYTLNDKGSQIMVVAKETLPVANKQVIVIGAVENFMLIGNESLGLHLSEIKRIDNLF